MNTATEAQLKFIATLKAERDITTEEAKATLEIADKLEALGDFDKSAASAVISLLLNQPRLNARPASAPASEGMHLLDGIVYKVQRAVHGSGNLYAKRLVLGQNEFGETSASFEYAPGAIRSLNEDTKMSLEQAKEFGALYGTCCVCGRTLTNEVSIEAGIGPICAGRF